MPTTIYPNCPCCSSSSSSSSISSSSSSAACCDPSSIPFLTCTVTPRGFPCGCNTPTTFQLGWIGSGDISTACGASVGTGQIWSSDFPGGPPGGGIQFCPGGQSLFMSLQCTGGTWLAVINGSAQCTGDDVSTACASASNQLSCDAVLLMFNGVHLCGHAEFGSDCILDFTITN